MKKYKVTLQLIIDPFAGDATISRTYYVMAKSGFDAFTEAQKDQTLDEDEFKYLSTLDYTAKIIK